MDLKRLQEHVDKRFDKIEEKLDSFARQTIDHANDLKWVKGHVTWIITLIVAVSGFFLTLYFKG